MAPEFAFSAEQTRLASLAIAYHLGRPGSEIDPETLQPSHKGLRMPGGILDAQRDLPQAKLTLDDYQVHRLGEAMLQTINELKVLAMAEPPWTPGTESGHSVNLEFERAAARLYPVLEKDPAAAQEVAGAMMLLYRRLSSEAAAPRTADPPPAAHTGDAPSQGRPGRRPWWRRILGRGTGRPRNL